MPQKLSRRKPSRSSKASAKVADPDSAKEDEETAVELAKTLLSWSQLEEWQKDNEYIVSGYRRAQNSWRACFDSVFGYWHNESVNIHTHVFGAILFVMFLLVNHTAVMDIYKTATWRDSLMISIFLTSAVFCLAASSIYHVSIAHSESVAKLTNNLDYSGIVVLIVGSFFPAIYYAFFCDARLQLFYLALIAVSGGGAAYIVLSPEYSKPTHRGARTKVFVALGLSAVLPVSHNLLRHGLHTLRGERGLDWLVASGAMYIIGALLYANRIPERFSPGRFDYVFASHQIFHVLVVLAALSHYAAVLTDLHHWHGRKAGTCTL